MTTLKQVPKFKYLCSIIKEEGKNKEDIPQQIKEAEVMFVNENQLLCLNALSLERKWKIQKVVFVMLLFVDQKQGP